MVYRNVKEIKDNFKVGDSIWACAFSVYNDKETKMLYQEPIKGEFCASRRKSLHDDLLKFHKERGTSPSIATFVPYKKNGKDLAWSKAIDVSGRIYATTEVECISLFNTKVDKQIEWCKEQIKQLEKMKL